MIYFDHNATTPPAPAVIAAMLEAMRTHWANASSAHTPGQDSKRALAQARATVATVLGCKPAEVIFTSGATEANHLAVRGLLAAAPPERRRVLFSAVEHAGQLRLAQSLAEVGVDVAYLQVSPDGALDLDAARALITPGVALVSMMAANNETGVLMPVQAISALCRAAGVPLHLDATQWIGKYPFVFEDCGADAVSFSAHKFHGPKGVGALLLRRGLFLQPLFPGSQERARRGGTENLPAIAGLAAALQGLGDLSVEAARQARLRERLEAGLTEKLSGFQVFGASQPRLPGTSCWRVATLDADIILNKLERLGIAASSGSACSSTSSEPSPVLSAMGVPREEALAAVRISLGRDNTAKEIDALIDGLPPLLLPLLASAAGPGPTAQPKSPPSSTFNQNGPPP